MNKLNGTHTYIYNMLIETKAEDQIRKKSKSRKSKKTVEESNPNQGKIFI